MAVEAESVDSIVMPPPQLTHPPGSSAARPGIFRHGEHTHALVDLHARLGLSGDYSQRGRLLLYHQGTRYYAQQVDEVIGLVQPEDGQWGSLPSYLPRELFWSGLFYRDEILLCSALDKLRDMHDIAPLQRLLRAQAEKPPSRPTASTPANATPATPSRATTLDSANPPSRQVSPSARQSAPKPSATTATTPRRPSPTKPKPRPTQGTNKDRGRADPHRPAAPPRPTSAPRPAPSSRPPRAPAAPAATSITTTSEAYSAPRPQRRPATREGGLFWLLPLLMLLIAAGFGWQALHSPEPAPTVSPPLAQSTAPAPAPATSVPPHHPPPRTAAPPRSAPDASSSTARGAPETQTTDDPAAPTPEAPAFTPRLERPPEAKAAPALILEREADGTLNLIIDRQALLDSVTPPAPSEPVILSEASAPALPDAPDPSEADLATPTPPPPPSTPREDAPATEQPPAPLAAPHRTATPATESAPGIALSPQAISPQAEPSVWFDPSARPLEPCECVHIVGRGDTLWSIARRYTGNAYNYPLLARQSGIANPDLIYPGDRIRITIR